MAKVFLSYAREDVDIARQLAEWIGRAGHEVWWDRHIHGGTRFTSEIDRALKDAEAIVVVWSEASVDSAWVQDEASEGRDSGRLVPIRLGRSRPPLGFRQFHCITLGDWDGSGEPPALEELHAAIAKTTREHEESAPAPPQPEPRKQHLASICVLRFNRSCACVLNSDFSPFVSAGSWCLSLKCFPLSMTYRFASSLIRFSLLTCPSRPRSGFITLRRFSLVFTTRPPRQTYT